MRAAILAILLCSGCSSSADAGTTGGGDTAEAGTSGEGSANGGDDASSGASDATAEAGDASCVFWVDDAGITHGCNRGGQGPGDKDDGGGAPAPPPPTVSPDAGNLPLGSSCWDDGQCASQICFDYAVRGTFCTQRCFTSANCPPPSNGCNGMGVCRFGDGGS
ncbi:MAG TPA: hypothetical protein VIF09_09880 [Polyangiaceae bacterium]|jgi:hypothetical protein